MPKYAKHIALLAAFAMLCGCTGNTGSTQTSTAEAVQTCLLYTSDAADEL